MHQRIINFFEINARKINVIASQLLPNEID